MATITQLIQELETIATAQVGLESFVYDNVAAVNAQRSRQYPLLLVDHQVGIDDMNLANRQRVYTLNLHFFDTWHRQQESQADARTPQRDIEELAEQFLQEFRARAKASHPWKVDNAEDVTGSWAYHQYNDRLIQLSYAVRLRSQGECTPGTFNY